MNYVTKKIIISDFDDTIFSREEQLEKEKILRENRWEKWNLIVKNDFWFDYMIDNYYTNKNFPQDIISKMWENDLIITAWMKEYQEKKIKSCWLDNIKKIIVKNPEEKIEALIEYICSLDFIPDQIEIYEDRPIYFIKNKNYLEERLNTRINIYYVEMDGNRWYKKIELQNEL